jgi:hypothetical protein
MNKIRLIVCSAFLTLFLVFTGCNEHTYKYVEIVEKEGLLGTKEIEEKAAEIIPASSDSAAYLAAYRKFCISMKVNGDMVKSLGTVSEKPLEFKLFNEKGKDIAQSLVFLNKAKLEGEILSDVLSAENAVKEAVDKNKSEQNGQLTNNTTIDSSKIKELTKFFTVKADEFSNNNEKWYTPKSAPKYANANGIYCYFQTENGIAKNMRFRLQYYADEWLFFNHVSFAIDGKAYEYTPNNTETDSGNGGYIWEWFDEHVTKTDMELLNALANAKSAKVKFFGKQYYNIKSISKDQMANIKRSLELYHAMGGEINMY